MFFSSNIAVLIVHPVWVPLIRYPCTMCSLYHPILIQNSKISPNQLKTKRLFLHSFFVPFMEATYHVHFGAGKTYCHCWLTFLLITFPPGWAILRTAIQLLRNSNSVPIAIIHRPRKLHDECSTSLRMKSESISFIVNKQGQSLDFKCVIDSESTVNNIEELLDNRQSIFVSTNNEVALSTIISRASSFSIPVGPRGLEDTLDLLILAQSVDYKGQHPRQVLLFGKDAAIIMNMIKQQRWCNDTLNSFVLKCYDAKKESFLPTELRTFCDNQSPQYYT
jgi:hypothetical protein